MIAASRELETKKRAEIMFDLTQVAAIPGVGTMKYFDGLKEYYRHIFEQTVPEHSSPSPQKFERPVIPWAQASELMFSALKLKKRLECGG